MTDAQSISIHALLAESDSEVPEDQYTALSISIHALLAESDEVGNAGAYTDTGFLSTLSLRRATMDGTPMDFPR